MTPSSLLDDAASARGLLLRSSSCSVAIVAADVDDVNGDDDVVVLLVVVVDEVDLTGGMDAFDSLRTAVVRAAESVSEGKSAGIGFGFACD